MTSRQQERLEGGSAPVDDTLLGNGAELQPPCGCLPTRTVRVVAVGWAVWTGVVAFLVGRFGLDSFAKWFGFAWVCTVLWLIQEWLDV